ncbi:hypothetical protein A3F66_06100 [candidate division TM6 bacterium RIFCSPHIGHO2_12_FULL_32_22]|nr:MAG: hypothetical protein A3F66_06100 [candidate division TM6 bacterium RIFCSPHIGHO2_12_FULL_32_22]
MKKIAILGVLVTMSLNAGSITNNTPFNKISLQLQGPNSSFEAHLDAGKSIKFDPEKKFENYNQVALAMDYTYICPDSPNNQRSNIVQTNFTTMDANKDYVLSFKEA